MLPTPRYKSVERVRQLGVQILTVTPDFVIDAVSLSQQHDLLTDDAVIVAIMQAHGLSNLASADADFDRVPGVVRWVPA